MTVAIFARHRRRRVIHLTGLWDFTFLGDIEPDAVDPAAIVFDDRMPVPACFDATPRYAGKRGLAAYRTTVSAHGADRCRFVFDGVHHWSRLFVNGAAVGDHAGGFTRFSHDAFALDGQAELIVLVDNRLDRRLSPLHQSHYDWYQYGGIARGVELHELRGAWIESVQCTTTGIDPPTIRVAVSAASTAPAAPLTVSLGGRTLHRSDLRFGGGVATFEGTFALPHDTPLWSPQSPHLHHLAVTLGDYDWHERIGLRTVACRGRDILLNGQPVRLLGFNRHESHPQFGHAQPLPLIHNDLQLLRDMGCNFLRGSHYPQDRRTLDLCDELGILVWCEAIAWGNTATHLADKAFVDAQFTNADEMIDAARNHPSVIMWGVLNEGPSDDAASRLVYERLLAHLRKRDPYRLAAYASNRPQRDICFDLADVVALNLYPGWYHGGLDDIGPYLDSITDLLARKGQADKPLLVSETGAGAIYGTHDSQGTLWSEEYQADVLETIIRRLMMERDHACGIAIWQFCDVRTTEQRDRALLRPRGFNNKGVVDEYRRPKLAYHRVRTLFGQLLDTGGS